MEVKIKGIAELEEGLVKYLESLTDNSDIKNQIGEKTVQYIKASIRTGNEEYAQPGVSASWAQRRKELSKTNEVSQFAPRGSQSRLTFTGEFLDGLTFTPITNGISLSFEGEHKPYNGTSGAIGKPVSNATIAEGLSRTRKFIFVSLKLKTQLETILTREIRRGLSGYQKLSRYVAKSKV